MPITIDERRTGATSISRRKPNSRSHTIEAALKIAVNITDMHRMPGKMNVGQVQPGAEREQEQQRLDERRDDAEPVLAEADELARPDDLDRAQLVAVAALGHPDADDVEGAHRPAIIRMIMRFAFGAASASRIVLPVKDMNTSSRLGRDTLTDVIGTSSSANSCGTNCAPLST